MTPLVDIQPRMSGHCGAFQYLRVRKDLPEPPASNALPVRSSPAPRRKWISLYIGEVAASQSPIVLDTLLGSCVAACLYDPVLRAGGINHILLPNCGVGDRSPRCGVHAMELLINELMKLGGDRRRFVAKAFGGANVLKGIRMLPIGERNVKFVREFLAAEKIPLVGERLGGAHAIHLYFRTDTGKATVHTVDGSSLPKLITAERSYWKPLSADKTFGGEITLF